MKRVLLFLVIFFLLTSLAWADETKVIEGTTNVEDTHLKDSTPNYNFGASTGIAIGIYSAATYHALIRVKNVSSELGVGATITSCTLSLYCNWNSTNDEISSYSVFKPYVEGTKEGGDPSPETSCTWDDWSSDDYEWGTAGCENADDEGEDNSGDGTGADRKATAEGTTNVTDTGWWKWHISITLAQAWYDGTKNEEGVMLRGAGSGYNSFNSTENAENQAFWTFTYTTDGAPEVSHRRRRLLAGER